MKKYWICRGLAGIYLGKINKNGTEFLDKEILDKSEVLNLLCDCINYLLDWDDNYLEIKSNWKVEFEIKRNS